MTVAFEVAVGMVLAVAIGASTVLAVQEVHQRWGESSLATAQARAVGESGTANGPAGLRTLEGPFELGSDAVDYTLFDGVRDELLLAPLRSGEIKRVKFNYGGSSISLRIDFKNGARAAFKPRQINMHSNPRKEIAAYRINRLLGLSSVPPTIGRRFSARKFFAAIDVRSRRFMPRLNAEVTLSGDYIDGELSWWIPIIEHATISGYRIDTTDGIVTWMRYLAPYARIPRRYRRRLAQISDMIVFDYLIDNSDRWTGGNARTNRQGRVLYFMDNTMSFGRDPRGHKKAQLYFKRARRFSRRLVARIRALTPEDFRASLRYDKGPFEYLLAESEIRSMITRRRYILEYVDDLIETHGEDNVLAFR